jgi:hypothetical protein
MVTDVCCWVQPSGITVVSDHNCVLFCQGGSGPQISRALSSLSIAFGFGSIIGHNFSAKSKEVADKESIRRR